MAKYSGQAEWQGCQCASAKPYCSAPLADGKNMCDRCSRKYGAGEDRCRPNLVPRK